MLAFPTNDFSDTMGDNRMKRREKLFLSAGADMSAFLGKNEFSGTAVDNRMKRRQKFTPFMRWEFRRDLFRMLRNIRNIKPSIDQGPPKQPSVETMNRSRRIVEEGMHRSRRVVEEGRLRLIEKENQQILERLRKIHNRPRSHFCHLKRRGDYLIKGDAFRLKKPTSAGYLVRLYKDLKLANPVTNRKSIRVQQEMLTSAMEMVQASANRLKPSEDLIDSVVQLTLATVDEVPSSPDATTSEGGASSDDDGISTSKNQQEQQRNDDGSASLPELDTLASPDASPTKPESPGK